MTTPRSTDHIVERAGGLMAIPRAAIRALDTLIRRIRNVQEFTNDELCLLRIAMAKSDQNIILSDGTEIAEGETIGELHLWNEHIPPMPEDGTYFTWGIRFYSLMLRSLRALARYLAEEPEWGNIRAWRGESAFVPKDVGGPGLFSRLGFDVTRQESSLSYMRKFVGFWENFYWWMLGWTFNPASLKHKKLLELERWQVWVSSAKLQQKYESPRIQSTGTFDSTQ